MNELTDFSLRDLPDGLYGVTELDPVTGGVRVVAVFEPDQESEARLAIVFGDRILWRAVGGYIIMIQTSDSLRSMALDGGLNGIETPCEGCSTDE